MVIRCGQEPAMVRHDGIEDARSTAGSSGRPRSYQQLARTTYNLVKLEVINQERPWIVRRCGGEEARVVEGKDEGSQGGSLEVICRSRPRDLGASDPAPSSTPHVMLRAHSLHRAV